MKYSYMPDSVTSSQSVWWNISLSLSFLQCCLLLWTHYDLKKILKFILVFALVLYLGTILFVIIRIINDVLKVCARVEMVTKTKMFWYFLGRWHDKTGNVWSLISTRMIISRRKDKQEMFFLVSENDQTEYWI